MHNRYLSLLTFWHNSFQQISRTSSLQHLNIGGTFITDESLFAIAVSCRHLKVSLEENCLLSQLGFIYSDTYKAKMAFLLFMIRVLHVEISILPLTLPLFTAVPVTASDEVKIREKESYWPLYLALFGWGQKKRETGYFFPLLTDGATFIVSGFPATPPH